MPLDIKKHIFMLVENEYGIMSKSKKNENAKESNFRTTVYLTKELVDYARKLASNSPQIANKAP